MATTERPFEGDGLTHDDGGLPLEMRALRERLDEQADRIANLEQAIERRDVIGQAKGIIMNTLHCDADEAFRLLVRRSQHVNRKLHDVAADIAERNRFD